MKRGSLTQTALHPDLALVSGDNLASDGQSQPHASGGAPWNLKIILEDLLMILRRNARAVVGDGEAHAVGRFLILFPAPFRRDTHRGDPALPEVQVGHQRHASSFRSILQSVFAETV